MSGDEVFALLVSFMLGALFIGRWYAPLLLVRGHGRRGARWPLALAPPAAGAALFILLANWASFDVRGSGQYLFLYMAMGAGWVCVATVALPLLGLHVRDDAIERGNPAAARVAAAAVLGITACYAGANVGDGPGWWCVVVAGGLAQGAWFAAWLALELAARPLDAVTIDRDPAAGTRLAGFLVAVGLIAGRAAAGDWTSAAATVHEFAAAAWPILPLLATAMALERRLRPSPRRPAGDGLVAALVALLYLGFAIAAVVALGPPPHGTFHPAPLEAP